MTQRENLTPRVCDLSQCPPEIQAVLHTKYQGDPARLRQGDQLIAYVASSNTTETWEVIAPGATATQVMVRLTSWHAGVWRPPSS